MAAELPVAPTPVACVGRIPVRNLWLLMLYASELFKVQGLGHVAWEDNPDDLPDLVAEILVHAVEQRQHRPLSRGLQSRHDALNRVRGRIDVLGTERRNLLARGMIACHFAEFTLDTPRNRYVRGALVAIGALVRRAEVAHRCRSCVRYFDTLGVAAQVPTRAQMSTERFDRNDADDRAMLAAAHLAFELALPTEDAGANHLPTPDREGTWVRQLFERAVAGFYQVTLAAQGWKVRHGGHLSWQVEAQTAGIATILPAMKTDIVLDHPASGRRIVIDTKFNAIVTPGWYRAETLRSAYIYQMYAYLRSQVGRGDAAADTASGVLLHPAVGTHVDETVVIQGHALRFMTVDLAGPAQTWRQELLRVCDRWSV